MKKRIVRIWNLKFASFSEFIPNCFLSPKPRLNILKAINSLISMYDLSHLYLLLLLKSICILHFTAQIIIFILFSVSSERIYNRHFHVNIEKNNVYLKAQQKILYNKRWWSLLARRLALDGFYVHAISALYAYKFVNDVYYAQSVYFICATPLYIIIIENIFAVHLFFFVTNAPQRSSRQNRIIHARVIKLNYSLCTYYVFMCAIWYGGNSFMWLLFVIIIILRCVFHSENFSNFVPAALCCAERSWRI